MRKEKLADLVRLARALAANGEGLTLDEMAVEASVNRRTAERMRDTLAELFPTLEEVREGRQKRFRIPSGVDGFALAPTPEELAEVDHAARGLESGGGMARAALLRSLGAKLKARLREREKARIEPDLEALMEGEGLVMQAGPRPMVDAALLAGLRQALKARLVCHFDYASATGHTYRRVVAPCGLLYGRTYYLVGVERGKDEPVLYRLDRVGGLDLGENCGPVPPGFDLRRFAARSFGAFQEAPETIVLRFAPEAAADVARFSFHPDQTVEGEPGGATVVRFTAGGLRELVHHLFTWGTAVEVVAPERLRLMLIADLKTALDRHTGTAGLVGQDV
jgi:predicted DNA-binding transcriptional regulator YafY